MSEPTRDWLIWEGRSEIWWRPERKGYTRNILEAGLYTEAEANQIRSGPNDTRRDIAIHVSKERDQIEILRAGLARIDEVLPKEHDLKTWPEFYAALASGRKTFEVRKNDRGFGVGDVLLLREWDPTQGCYTGCSVRRRVTYIMQGGLFGLSDGYCCMGLAVPA